MSRKTGAVHLSLSKCLFGNASFTILVILAIALISISSDGYAFMGGRIAQPADLDRVAYQMDDFIYQASLPTLAAIQSGKFDGKSPEALLGFSIAVKKGFEEFGFSMDATFRAVFEQRNMYFWQRTFYEAGYEKLFFSIVMGLTKSDSRHFFVKNGIVSAESIEAWDEYLEWAKSLERKKN